MVTKTWGSAVYGVSASLISIEVNIIKGTHFFMVGLPDSAVKESQHRIESVFKHMGCVMPKQRVIVNLAPADMRKEGASYDLPIALCILHASQQYHFKHLSEYVILGELALNGGLRPVKGVLPIAVEARRRKCRGLILPQENAPEASVVDGLTIVPVAYIQEAISFFLGTQETTPTVVDKQTLFDRNRDESPLDFSDVQGQENIKRALEIAAAGGHNVVMVGPPGAGKTMLAKRISSILPPFALEEAIETTKIYSVLGKLGEHEGLVVNRPFRSPHHTISDVALVGGGSIPQPGEISLAHNGVLFLDELPEFRRAVLEVMRQPLEERKVTISRARIAADFPASFMLIASMNPCPCGYYNHPTKTCVCDAIAVRRYLNKISGPLLDRIDLHVEVTPISFDEMITHRSTEKSMVIRERVVRARTLQQRRFSHDEHVYANAMMPTTMLKKLCAISQAGRQLLKAAIERLGLSARAYDRILKVSRTIADLAGAEAIKEEHLAEAIQYRSLDREGWGS